jgi:HD-like signal output (HDOD) protein
MSLAEQNRNEILKKILVRVNDFPTLPTIYTKLSEVMANPMCSASDIAAVIAQDQSSATKVLKISNSAIYGNLRRIRSIQDAVFIIGTREIKAIVLALAIIKLFAGAKETEALKPNELWEYSFAVGAFSRNIAKELRLPNPEDLFVAGIIHGIGKLFFLIGIPELYSKVIMAGRAKKIKLREVEKLILGITHSSIAQLLSERWRLPQEFTIMFENQYRGLNDGKFHPYSTVVHLAMVSASMMQFGDSGTELVPTLNKEIWKHMELDPKFYSKNLEIIKKEVLEMRQLLGE